MASKIRKINAAGLGERAAGRVVTHEYVYADRASGLPHLYEGAARSYTENEAVLIEKNFADTATTLRSLTPLDRVMRSLGRDGLSRRDIHRVKFDGRPGYHDHLKNLPGFVAAPRDGQEHPLCFREDGSSMYVVIIDDELQYTVEETLWSEGMAEPHKPPAPAPARRTAAKKGGRKK